MENKMQIALYEKLNNPIEAITKIGELFAKSGMFGCERVEQGQVIAMAALTEGKTPIQLLREYHIIEGRLSDRADSMLAKFRAAGGKHKILVRTAEKASVELIMDGTNYTSSLTWDEVKEEPFVKSKDGLKKNWRTPRARMQSLWARVISDGVRTVAPEIVAGIFTPEEITDDTDRSGATTAPAQSLTDALQAAKPVIPVPVAPEPVKTPEPNVTEAIVVEPEVKKVEPTPQHKHAKTLPVAVQLEEIIGNEHAEAALTWLKARGWITNHLGELSEERAQRILQKPSEFLKTIYPTPK